MLAYDFSGDIAEFVKDHSTTSLEFGEGGELTYDFAAIEQYIVDRWVLSSSSAVAPVVFFLPSLPLSLSLVLSSLLPSLFFSFIFSLGYGANIL